MLNKAQVLAAQDLMSEVVPVPEWGGDIKVRMLNGLEREEFQELTRDAAGKIVLANYSLKLLAMTIVEEDGSRMFTMDELPQLGAKSPAAIDRLFPVAARLNGLLPSSVDDAEKNSLAAPSGASSSDTPSPSAEPSESSSQA
jgi:hypothetical protein